MSSILSTIDTIDTINTIKTKFENFLRHHFEDDAIDEILSDLENIKTFLSEYKDFLNPSITEIITILESIKNNNHSNTKLRQSIIDIIDNLDTILKHLK